MELQLMYRFLRKVSDWALSRYYSEVFVDGKENIPRDSPLIVAASHHNDILDIATLASTIPYRRHLAYWAKASLFLNPINRVILLSSGTIPVRRNPNNAGSQPTADAKGDNPVANTNGASGKNRNAQADLFRESTRALSRGRVIGVFVEGMSHTGPRLAQIMPGAAWAAMNFVRSERERVSSQESAAARDLLIVPAGIVYSDKSRYRSRVRVHYGIPLSVNKYLNEVLAEDGSKDIWDEEIGRAVVKKLTAAIQTELLRVTINAPDWDTLLAARMAREILWMDDTVPLRDFVPVSQKLVDMLSLTASVTSVTLANTRRLLLRYYSLLHYTSIDHASLSEVTPTKFNGHRSLLSLLLNTLLSLFHPRFLFFFPVLLLHLPLYVIGAFAGRRLAVHRRDAHSNAPEAGPDGKGELKPEEEGQAQFKSIVPGFVAGWLYLGVAWCIVRWLSLFATTSLDSSQGSDFVSNAILRLHLLNVLRKLGSIVAGGEGTVARILGIVGIVRGTGWILARWHDSLVDGNHRQLKRTMTALKLAMAAFSEDITPTELEAHFTRPPLPPRNPFLNKNTTDSVPARSSSTELADNQDVSEDSKRRSVKVHRLVRPLLQTRQQVIAALKAVLEEEEPAWSWLRQRGAQLPS